MSINQSINQYYCDNFHVQNLFPEYLYLVGEIFTSRSPSDPDVVVCPPKIWLNFQIFSQISRS